MSVVEKIRAIFEKYMAFDVDHDRLITWAVVMQTKDAVLQNVLAVVEEHLKDDDKLDLQCNSCENKVFALLSKYKKREEQLKQRLYEKFENLATSPHRVYFDSKPALWVRLDKIEKVLELGQEQAEKKESTK
jgi:hypothetical protein